VREFVPFVSVLGDLAGGYQRALEWVDLLQRVGIDAFRQIGLTTDTRMVAEGQARELGLVDAEGNPDIVRCAQLILVLDIVAAVPLPRQREPHAEPLVFTVPPEVNHLLAPGERLDNLVADVIRSATDNLQIGGPYWNAEGFSQLRPVLQPALEVRHITCDFYLHRSRKEYNISVQRFISELGDQDRVNVWWYAGDRGSLMHAKFCIADKQVGYFGSANLTSLGLRQHIEVGIKLSPEQCQGLTRLFLTLVQAGLFTRKP
jgi:phosphatidylserine/phosphatidylglycerophosphate/cardiolipin synthase-like enzyme